MQVFTACANAPPGLLKGLGDPRLATALQRMHARIDHAWTVPELAQAAALSRSSFFERFTRAVGVAPMEYLLGWRMAIAKDLLRRGELQVAQIARARRLWIGERLRRGVPPARGDVSGAVRGDGATAGPGLTVPTPRPLSNILGGPCNTAFQPGPAGTGSLCYNRRSFTHFAADNSAFGDVIVPGGRPFACLA